MLTVVSGPYGGLAVLSRLHRFPPSPAPCQMSGVLYTMLPLHEKMETTRYLSSAIFASASLLSTVLTSLLGPLLDTRATLIVAPGPADDDDNDDEDDGGQTMLADPIRKVKTEASQPSTTTVPPPFKLTPTPTLMPKPVRLPLRPIFVALVALVALLEANARRKQYKSLYSLAGTMNRPHYQGAVKALAHACAGSTSHHGIAEPALSRPASGKPRGRVSFGGFGDRSVLDIYGMPWHARCPGLQCDARGYHDTWSCGLSDELHASFPRPSHHRRALADLLNVVAVGKACVVALLLAFTIVRPQSSRWCWRGGWRNPPAIVIAALPYFPHSGHTRTGSCEPLTLTALPPSRSQPAAQQVADAAAHIVQPAACRLRQRSQLQYSKCEIARRVS